MHSHNVTEAGRGRVRPLPAFDRGPRAAKPFAIDPQMLEPLVGTLAVEVKDRVAEYLSSGVTIIPLMGYTEDLLGQRFGVSGGAGLLSDGMFYWRRDVAEYVREYGIDVGAVAVEHMRKLRWKAPQLSPDDIAEIDDYLYGLASGK